MKQAFLLTILFLLVGGVANAAEWVNVNSNRSSSHPRPGATLKFVLDATSGQTGIINRELCGDDSSFSVDSAANVGATGAVQTCKEGAGSLTDCEADASAGSVTVGNYAIIRQGTYVRLDYSSVDVADIFYFDCNAP